MHRDFTTTISLLRRSELDIFLYVIDSVLDDTAKSMQTDMPMLSRAPQAFNESLKAIFELKSRMVLSLPLVELIDQSEDINAKNFPNFFSGYCLGEYVQLNDMLTEVDQFVLNKVKEHSI